MSADGIDWKELHRRHATREYVAEAQDGDNAGQPIARVAEHPLDRMYRGRLTRAEQRQYDAGKKLRRDYEASIALSCPAYDGTPIPTSSQSRQPTHAQMDAAARFRWAMEKLGMWQASKLVAFCCWGDDVGQIFGVPRTQRWDHSKCTGMIQAALEALADMYRMPA